MKKIFLFSLVFIVFGCKFYSFTGASIPENAETVQVNLFVNDAANSIGSTFEPGLDRDFTNTMQEVLIYQTNLELTGANGDLIYEGEITEYRVTPTTATAQQTAAQNRLTVTINVVISTPTTKRIILKKGFLTSMISLTQRNFKV